MKRELPGDVMVAFREEEMGHPRSKTVFAELAGSNYTKIYRIESIRWGVPEAQWRHHFDMVDLEPFVESGLMKKGDHWYERFRRSCKWQALVMQHGEAVYEGGDMGSGEYARISSEHLAVVVRAVLQKLLDDMPLSHVPDEQTRKEAEHVLGQGMRSILDALDLLMAADEASDRDITRGVLWGMIDGRGRPTGPYMRTLEFAVRCALVVGRERLEEMAAGQDL